MKKFLVLCSLFAMIFGSNLIVNAANKVIDAMSVKAAQLGAGYQQANSFYVDEQALKTFKIKFNADLVALKNDIFNSNDNRVQINYIEADSTVDAEKVYKQMVDLVGNSNVVAIKDDVVIEIITKSNDMKKKIVNLLKPAKVHTNY